MTRKAGLVLAAALFAALPASAAHAEVDKARVRQVIESTGLMGFWAVDCSKPASGDNPWETFTVDAEGYVVDGDYEGTDGEAAYVVEARRIGANKVWFRYEVTLGEPELELVYEIRGDRHRTWSSRAPDGSWLIQRGVWQTDEEPGQARWYRKCPVNRFPDQPPDE